MAKRGRKNKASINKQLWDRANGTHRTKWVSKSQQGYDFYLDEQLSSDEIDNLDEAGMPTFTINRILPIVEIMKYFVTANNPRWKAVGVTGDDVDIAQVHSELADYAWHLSNGKSLYGQVVLDSLVKGVGYFLVDVDQDMDNGKGEVTFSRIDPYDVFVDPSSRDFLFRDAGFIMIKKYLSKTQLKNMFPQYSAKINKASGDTSGNYSYSQTSTVDSKVVHTGDIQHTYTPDSEEDELINYYENYSKVKVPFVNVFLQIQPSDAELAEIKKSVDVQVKEFSDEVNVEVQEKVMQIQQALQAGEIIEDRASLEIEKAQKMAETAIQEKQQELMSMAQDAVTRVDQQVLRKKILIH